MTDPSPRQNLATRIAMTVAVVALPFAMLSVWVNVYVSDTDRYVQKVTPLASDPAVRKAAVNYVERETLSVLDSSDQVADSLRSLDLSCLGVDSTALGGFADLVNGFLTGSPLGNELMAQVRPLIQPTIHTAIVAAIDSPAFAQVWVAGNREAHRQVLAVLQDKPVKESGGSAVLIGLQEMVKVFTGDLPCESLITPALANQINPALTLVNAEDLEQARFGYRVLDASAVVLPIVFVLAVAVAFATGRRRARTGWQLGLGFAAGMLVLHGILLAIRASITSNGVDEDVFDAIWDVLTHPLVVVMIVVGVVSVIGAAAALLADRRSTEPVA